MTIKKKDGNVYVLEGPNKLLKEQQKIDLSKCVFHNFNWNEVVSKRIHQSKTKTVPPPPKNVFVQPLEEIKIEDIKIEEKVEEDLKVEEEIKDEIEFKLPLLKIKVLMYCLPAKLINKKDSFYGDNWQVIKYGKKFIFPSVMISNNDLQMEFWTSDPKNQISEKSIIYPFSYEVYNQETNSYDRVPFDEYRWWKVTKKEEKQGGYLFATIPSQDQPDFSD